MHQALNKLSSFIPAQHVLGADLFWWQHSESIHTLISILWAHCGQLEDAVNLSFVLFDAGEKVAGWSQTPRQLQSIFVNSADPPIPLPDVQDGVLAVIVSTDHPPSKKLRDCYNRLYSLIDWYSPGETICSLHNDQSLTAAEGAIEFTEIVVTQTEEQENFLVITNGPLEILAGSLVLQIKNCEGITQESRNHSAIRPFEPHRVELLKLFPDIIEFSQGEHLLVTGFLSKTALFIRPYVMTRCQVLSGYHGGDRNPYLKAIPEFRYKFLERGEFNPIVAVHNGAVTSTANILHSHGSLEDDCWIDLSLYDESGHLLADKKRYVSAKRFGLARVEMADLLPADYRDFTGQLIASFSDDGRSEYPAKLQILMEYRTRLNVSRVMVWSDSWNSPERLAKEDRPVWHKYQRVWMTESLRTYLSIGNMAGHRDYDNVAPFTLTLERCDGEKISYQGAVKPFATLFATIDTFFPEAENFLHPHGFGMVFLDTEFDLPSVQFTEHRVSGAWAAEHFMSYATEVAGKRMLPAGS